MKRVLATLMSAALLSACVDTPTTIPSQVALKGDALGLGTAPAPAVSDTWWTAFNDPQLNSLIDQALKGSPTLAAALARVREAQSQLSSARAQTYPQITLDGNEVYQRFSKNYIIPPPYGGTDQWFGTTQANLSWNLDLFGKLDSQVARARAGAHAAALDAAAARLLLAGSVTQAYVSLWRAYVLIDIDADTVKQREGIAGLTAGRVKAGLDTLQSRRQSDALLALSRQELTRAKALRDLGVHQIAALLGRGADAYAVTRPRLNEAALSLPARLPGDLLMRRADIAAGRARIDAAFQGREIARKAYYPDINLIALAGTAAIGLGPLFSSASAQYGGGAAIHLPIFDAGKLDADYAGATAVLDETVADYNETVVTAVRQTADAVTNIQSLQNQSADQRSALSDAQASFDLSVQRYRSGLSPQQNTLDAESLLIQARAQGAALSADTLSARVALLMALGGGWQGEPNISADAISTDNRTTNHE
jgi:NodT family efflux transporter outer membrane factor (OMF) lipoprotein